MQSRENLLNKLRTEAKSQFKPVVQEELSPVEYFEPVGSNTGENGTFSKEQRAQQPVVEVLQRRLKTLFENIDTARESLKTTLAIVENQLSPENQAAIDIRAFLAELERFETNANAPQLHVSLNNIFKAIGGSGLPYFR